MKRNFSLWLGLLAFALLPVFAQTPAAPKGATGKIHGHVSNPTGAAESGGLVILSTDGGHSAKYTFEVTTNGDYAGEAAPGTYTLVYRQKDTPADKMVDFFEGVKVVADQNVVQDVDMSRKDYVDKLPAEQQKQLEELKKKNSEVMKANEIIKGLNNDIITANQDFKEAESARATAIKTLGASASPADIEGKVAEIKTAKYTEAETIMLRDTQAKPDASVLFAVLGQAQLGLRKYDESEAAYKKTLEIEAASKKPSLSAQGAANAGLGEIYARTGKVAEANASYDAAAKINPTAAALYLKNEAIIFTQVGNTDAAAAAADEAIKADPTQPLPYYLKGQGLIGKATVDEKTHLIVLPPDCAEAYQKYLQLAPTGQYAADVKGILQQAGQKVDTNYKAPKK